MLTGRLTTRRALEDKIHEANEWRAEGRIKDQAIITTLDQVKAAAEAQGVTLHKFISDLQSLQRDPNRNGGQ